MNKVAVAFAQSLNPLFFVALISVNSAFADRTVTPVTQDLEAQSWWMPRHQEILHRHSSDERVDLIWIGDSITHDWEGRGSSLWQSRYQSRHASNLGFSGDQTQNVLWRLKNGELDNISPKVAVVMIGTNNTRLNRDEPQDIYRGVKEIVTLLRLMKPEMKILLLGIFPCDFAPHTYHRQNNQETNALLKLLPQQMNDPNIHFLDLWDHFVASDGTISQSIMFDQVHLSALGFKIWSDALEPLLSDWLR